MLGVVSRQTLVNRLPSPFPSMSDRSPPGHIARGSLHDIWLLWCQPGAGGAAAHGVGTSHLRAEIGVAQFVKMMRETGLLDKTFTAVQAELIFVRAKSKVSSLSMLAIIDCDVRGLKLRSHICAIFCPWSNPLSTDTFTGPDRIPPS
jgi:hypothetical protein